MNVWQARFSKASNQNLNDFNSSIPFDSVMVSEDIQGSIAHVTMLGKQQIITNEDASLIIETLKAILQDIKQQVCMIDSNAEDIHMFIEQELTRRIGDVGKMLHTARSRNDQVALDLRLYTIKKGEEIIDLLNTFIVVICKKASANIDTIMPGYTHLQRAQPITFAHHLMAYVEMIKRDSERFMQTIKRSKVSPLGCGALATTTYPIDPEYTKDLLGFDSTSQNSLDGVSDRDYAIDMASAIATTMMHLSRLSEEIILWSSWEFKFIELDDAFATGSSIMPQKKNPDICELIRGKTGRTYGNLNQLLVMMKGLPLAYNKDMQEDKEALFDSIDTLIACVKMMIQVLQTCKVLKENMRTASAKGFINATDCADYLTKKGMPFRDAYKIVGKLVNEAIQKNQVLETLTLNEYKQASSLFEEDIYEAIALETCVNKRNIASGPAPSSVEAHIKSVLNERGITL